MYDASKYLCHDHREFFFIFSFLQKANTALKLQIRSVDVSGNKIKPFLIDTACLKTENAKKKEEKDPSTCVAEVLLHGDDQLRNFSVLGGVQGYLFLASNA